MRLAAGFLPDQLRELTALPRPPSWILGVGAGKLGKGREEGKGKRGGKERGEKEGRGSERKDGRDHPQQKNSYGPAPIHIAFSS